jgi:phosphate uptake regulator
MSVQLGRIYVAHALSKACASAASESPDLNLDRSVQRVDGVLRLAQRTLTEAQQLAGWPDPEVAVVSNLPDIRELVRSLEQEADHAKRVLRIRLPEKIALIRGIES